MGWLKIVSFGGRAVMVVVVSVVSVKRGRRSGKHCGFVKPYLEGRRGQG